VRLFCDAPPEPSLPPANTSGTLGLPLRAHLVLGLTSFAVATEFMAAGMFCVPEHFRKYMIWVLFVLGCILSILPIYRLSLVCGFGCDPEFFDQAGKFGGFPWGPVIGTYSGAILYLVRRRRVGADTRKL
jgi:hypothetical protein